MTKPTELTQTQSRIRHIQLSMQDLQSQLDQLLLQERFLLGRQSVLDELKSSQGSNRNQNPRAEPNTSVPPEPTEARSVVEGQLPNRTSHVSD